MIPEKDKRYLIKYKFGQDHYTDVGTYTGETYSDRGYTEYVIEVDDGTILATYEEIIECVNNPHDGSTLDNFLLLEEYNKLKAITDRILREFPVGNIAEHTIESIPERVSYYLKELAEYTQRVEDLEDKKLDPKQPICTKCVNNLIYYDGWHCKCEEIDRNCWVNFKQNNDWEKCADDLVDYAHEFVAHLSTWGKGYNRYDKDIKKAEDAIEEYLRLKNERT
jgi:hypothetical protein